MDAFTVSVLIVLAILIVAAAAYYLYQGKDGFTTCPSGTNPCPGCVCCVAGQCPAAGSCPAGVCPAPPPPPPRRVELVNGTGTTLLAGAVGPTPILPQEGRWDFGPGETLTLVLPDSWTNTAGKPVVGPRFWVRTGCAFDAATDKAQCETGDCGGHYDCSKAGLAGVAPASLAEFCFVCGGGLDYYDVSLVDGYNISVDIVPLPPFPAAHPGDPTDPFWSPLTGLCRTGADLRANCRCGFGLKRSQLASYVPGTPDATVACFSNCGRYEYPVAPLPGCPDTDPTCASWRKYCCQAETYGQPCKTDADCTDGGACWNGVCSCRAHYLDLSCPPDVCTNPGAQPAPALCREPDCIGDDTLHAICPRAYSWPNDPQTYNSASTTGYRITFGPGWGSLAAFPVTPPGPIPLCSSLPPAYYDPARARGLCGQLGTYGCAKTIASGQNWDCNVDTTGCNGVLCRWGP